MLQSEPEKPQFKKTYTRKNQMNTTLDKVCGSILIY